jgi:hypothetical protein
VGGTIPTAVPPDSGRGILPAARPVVCVICVCQSGTAAAAAVSWSCAATIARARLGAVISWL